MTFLTWFLFFCLLFLIFRTIRLCAMCYVLVLSEWIYTGPFLDNSLSIFFPFSLAMQQCHSVSPSASTSSVSQVVANVFGFNNNILYDDKKVPYKKKDFHILLAKNTIQTAVIIYGAVQLVILSSEQGLTAEQKVQHGVHSLTNK